MILKRFVLAGVMLSVLAFVAVLGGADPSSAGTFNPTLKIVLDDPAPETTSDFTSDFGLPIGDVNFAGVVAFIPSDWGIVNGADIPVGEDVGKLTAEATLGLIGVACNSPVPVEFNMKNGSLDRNDTVSFNDTDLNNTADYAEDKDKNGIFDAIDKYPAFINRIWDFQPIRRSAGISPVAGIPILLQFLVFPPGTDINENIPNDESLGFPSVTLLQAIGDPDVKPMPGAITDFCTPLASTNISFGSTYDADRDGFRNSDDTCPLNAAKPGELDADRDFIENSCDADDTKPNPDADGDGAANNQDNCPLEANPAAGDTDADGDGFPDQDDADDDGIGDACDPKPSEPDGLLDLSVNPQNGKYTFTTVTIGQRDADGDSFENGFDTCPLTANKGDSRIAGDGDVDQDGLDAACDPDDNPSTGGTNSDEDLDGYVNRQDNCPREPNGQDLENQHDEDLDQIGDVCDPDPKKANGELARAQPQVEITVGTGTGPGGPPRNCPTCFVIGQPPKTPPPKTQPVVTPVNGGDGGGTSTVAVVGIIVGVAAAVIVIGGGAAFMMRRKSS